MKNDLDPQITAYLDVRQFSPGEKLRGSAAWLNPIPSTSAELRLFYHTEGKGTQDVEVIDTLALDSPGPFEFQLPIGPYSFSGRLISLAWALELIIQPGGQVTRLDFVLSPTAEEIDLTRQELPEAFQKLEKPKFQFSRTR